MSIARALLKKKVAHLFRPAGATKMPVINYCMTHRPCTARSVLAPASLLPILLAFAVCAGCAINPPHPATPQSRAEADLHELERALVRYHHVTGQWPDNGEGFSALVHGSERRSGRHFLTALPVDPWGNRYQYRFNPAQGRLTLWSFGEDVVNSADDIRREVRIKN